MELCTKVIEHYNLTHLVLKPEYSGITSLILNTMAGDDQAPCTASPSATILHVLTLQVNWSSSSTGKDFNDLHHISAEKWWKTKYIFRFRILKYIQQDKR